MYTGESPNKTRGLSKRSGDHARNPVPPSEPKINRGGARAGSGRPRTKKLLPSAEEIEQAAQPVPQTEDEDAENSDPEDSEQMCSQKEKLQELKLLATDSGVELCIRESWRTLFSMVVMCMLAGGSRLLLLPALPSLHM